MKIIFTCASTFTVYWSASVTPVEALLNKVSCEAILDRVGRAQSFIALPSVKEF